MAEHRYYFLKLPEDFFKGHDIRIIESQPGGTELVLFYLKLMCESISHQGLLRFSERIPYDDAMLSVVLNTPIETVRQGMKILQEFELVSIVEDGSIYLHDMEKYISSEGSSASRMRKLRERQKEELLGQASQSDEPVTESDKNVTEIIDNRNKILDIRKKETISKEIVKKESADVTAHTPSKRFVKPTLEEIRAYCQEKGYMVNAEKFWNFYESKNWYVGKNKMTSWKAAIAGWNNREKEWSKEKSEKGSNIYAEMLRNGEFDGYERNGADSAEDKECLQLEPAAEQPD